MCMITAIPAGVEIPWEGITNGADFNDDGHGFAIASKDYGLQLFKSMDFEESADALRVAREAHGMNSIVLWHSRFATHGVTSEFNVHPFYTDESGLTVMAHNGVLPAMYHPSEGDPRSDTRIFTDRVLETYTEKGVPSRRQAKRLGEQIGYGNKLTFLSIATGEPKLRIVNAFLGTNADGVWYSNDGYLPSRWSWRGWKDNEVITLGRAEDKEAKWEDDFELPEECPFCDAFKGVDEITRVCDYCDTCYDCGNLLGDCMCFGVPWSEARYFDAVNN